MLYNKTQCYLTEKIEQKCDMACLNITSEICEPIEDLKIPRGSPCDDDKGYCDFFHKCRPIDEEGSLFRLTKLIFNQKHIENIVEWVKENYVYAILIGIASILLFGLCIKCTAVHTPSSNPRYIHCIYTYW